MKVLLWQWQNNGVADTNLTNLSTRDIMFHPLQPNKRKAVAVLQCKESANSKPITKVWGYLVGVELAEGVDAVKIGQQLADAVHFTEGTGDITVDLLGEITCEEEPSSKWPINCDKES